MKITLTNSKLGGFIPSLNLPAGITCRSDAPCFKDCYARKGNFTYPKVKQGYLNNLKEYQEDSEKFFNDVTDYLNNGEIIYKFFRWFSSGDIVDMNFLYGIIKVAKACPMTKFLCFTKKHNLVNMWLSVGNELPENLRIVFSGWDENFKVDNPFNLPTTYVHFKDRSNKHIPEFAIPCKGSCRTCKACWSLQKGQSVYFDKH